MLQLKKNESQSKQTPSVLRLHVSTRFGANHNSLLLQDTDK